MALHIPGFHVKSRCCLYSTTGGRDLLPPAPHSPRKPWHPHLRPSTFFTIKLSKSTKGRGHPYTEVRGQGEVPEVRQVVHVMGRAGDTLQQAPLEAPERGHVGGRSATGGGLMGGLARLRGRPGARPAEDEEGGDGGGVPGGGGGSPCAGQGKEVRELERRIRSDRVTNSHLIRIYI